MWVLFVSVCIFNQVNWLLVLGGRGPKWPQYSGCTGKPLTVWQASQRFSVITDEADKEQLFLCYWFMSNLHSYFLLLPTEARLRVSVDLKWLSIKIKDRLQCFSHLLCPFGKTKHFHLSNDKVLWVFQHGCYQHTLLLNQLSVSCHVVVLMHVVLLLQLWTKWGRGFWIGKFSRTLWGGQPRHDTNSIATSSEG